MLSGQKLDSDFNSGVSPTVGVIFLVAVVVILSVIVVTATLGMTGTVSDSESTQVGVSTDFDGNTVMATVVTGSADSLKLLVNGQVEASATDVSSGDSVSASALKGDSVTVVSTQNGRENVVVSKELKNRKITLKTLVDFDDGDKKPRNGWSSWKQNSDDLQLQTDNIVSGSASGRMTADGAGSRAYVTHSGVQPSRVKLSINAETLLESGESQGTYFQGSNGVAFGVTYGPGEQLEINGNTAFTLTRDTVYTVVFKNINYNKDTFDVIIKRASDGSVLYEKSGISFQTSADSVVRFGVGIDEDSGDNDSVIIDEVEYA